MPQFRSYSEATSLLDTDAFVIDRIGQGTMFIQSGDTFSGFRASSRAGMTNPFASTSVVKVAYDHIDYDTTGGFSLTQAVPTYGTFPAFKVPQTGVWRFETATQFFDNIPSGTDSISMLHASSQVSSTGATVEFNQFNSPLISIAFATAASKTFSTGFSFQAKCTAGDFLWINNDLENAATSSTLQINGGSATLACTFFSGAFVR